MTNKKTAILIDAENVSFRHIDIIFNELTEKNYDLKIKRAFADWTDPTVSSDEWKKVLNNYAIRPTHLFNFSNGKNASDIQMVVYGMKILYENPEIDNFIVVTSDSDFTPFVLALKESGKTVIGYGGEFASVSLKNACDDFTSIKLDKKPQIENNKPKKENNNKKEKIKTKNEINNDYNDICYNIWLNDFWNRDTDGWFRMDLLGLKLKEKIKNKTWKACGYKSLKDLIKNQHSLETKTVNDQTYVRPLTLEGDSILPIIEEAFKSKNKRLTSDVLDFEDILKFASKKIENLKLKKESFLDTPLYETLKSNGNVFLKRKMSKTEKELNDVFIDYCSKNSKQWLHLGAKAKEDIGNDIDKIKNKNKDLKNLSLSQLAKKTCSVFFRYENFDEGKRKEYYIKGF